MTRKHYRKTVRDPKTGTTLVVGNAGEYAALTQGQGWVEVTDDKPAESKTEQTKQADEPAPTVPATQTGGKTTTTTK